MYMPDQKRCAHCIKSCVTVIPSESNHESRSQIKKAKHPVYSIYIAYSLELRCIALPIDSSQTARVKKAWQAIGRSSFASTIARQRQIPFVTIKASTYALETLSQHVGIWRTNSKIALLASRRIQNKAFRLL